MKRFNVQGWERLSGKNPAVIAAREGVLSQLESVPEPHRTTWEKRLKSRLDHPHFSVRLEIYLYQFLRERGWLIEIEPELPGTRNRPDFVVNTDNAQMIIEAKTVLGAESERQQDGRLKQLMDDLSGKLNRTVLIHPMLDLPSSLPNKHIASEIESKGSESEVLQEFMVEGEHQGQPYSLEVTVLLEDKPILATDVGAVMGQARGVDIGHAVRKAIIEKARKYGEPNVPFVIAIWPKLGSHFSFADDDDLVALFGDEVWGVIPGSAEPAFEMPRKPNGAFTLTKDDGSPRYSRVSAVIMCSPDHTESNESNHKRDLMTGTIVDCTPISNSPIRVYHNPFAKRPVNMDAFKGIPQCTIDLTTGIAQWSCE